MRKTAQWAVFFEEEPATSKRLEDKNSRCSGCFCRKRRSFVGFSKRRKALQKSLENE